MDPGAGLLAALAQAAVALIGAFLIVLKALRAGATPTWSHGRSGSSQSVWEVRLEGAAYAKLKEAFPTNADDERLQILAQAIAEE